MTTNSLSNGARSVPRYRFALAAVLASTLAASLPHTALADGNADEAELHFQLARRRFEARDFDGALEHFFASNRLVRNRNVLFNIGGTYEQLGRLPEAHRYYYLALDGEQNPSVIRDVTAAIERLSPRVAVLSVETDPPNAAIFLDRVDLGERGRSGHPLAVAAGRYHVFVSLEGHEPAEVDGVEVSVGQARVVRLALRPIVGTVSVRGASGAVARADDDSRGRSCELPCALSLPPGPHSITVSREGFAPENRIVVVRASQQTELNVTLRARVGTLVVECDERDALVEVDGRAVGFAPVILRDIAVGQRRIRVSLQGFVPIEREVRVNANGEARLDNLRLEPVREVIAASRVAQRIDDAPASVTTLSAAEIQAFQYPTIAAALQGVRGVYLSNDRAYTSVGIRGLGQPNDYGNRVLVLQDGAVLNDNLLYSSYIGHDGRTSLQDVARIEIVRGPGSLLYGTGAISGVINLAMNGRDIRTGAEVGLGSYAEGVGRARARGSVRISPEAGVSLEVATAASQGTTTALDVPTPAGVTTQQVANVDRFLSTSLSGRAWWRDLTAQWSVAFQDHDIPVGAYATTVGDSATRWTDGRVMGELRFERQVHRMVQVLLRAHVNMYRFNGAYGYDAGAINRESYLGVWTGTEARLVITPVEALKITGGGEFQWHPTAQLDGEATDRTMPATAPTRYLGVSSSYTIGSGYGLLEWTPARWMTLHGGFRVDAFSTVPAGLSVRGAAIFRPSSRSTIKLLGGRAFRAPSTYEQRYTDGMTQRPGCPPGMACSLRPEFVTSGEIEWLQRIGDDWSLLVASNVSVLQDVLDTVGAGTSEDQIRYTNSDSGVLSVGGDLEVRREFRQGWFFAATYNLQHTRFLAPVAMQQAELVNAPLHQGSLKMIAPLLPPYANLAVRGTYVAPRLVRQDSDERTTPAILGDLVMSGQLPRLGLRWAFGVYNVLDWRWSVPITETFASRTMPQAGRTLAAHLQASF
ncbi:MAG: PEGA domain-containing protein [Deltaproteobacteria bacterium]|nr:PEGA domain-containing protein [Deltaproteobacteria bacterium]